MELFFHGFDVSVTFSQDFQQFNCSELYRKYYVSKVRGIWRKALLCFLLTPVIRGTFSLIRTHANKFPLHSRLHRNKEIYLHSGLLALALVDLRIINQELITQFNFDLRGMITEAVVVTTDEDVGYSEQIRFHNYLISKIIDMAINGKITIGGVSALLPLGQQHQDDDDYSSFSPRTQEALSHLTNLNQSPELLQRNDINLVLETALNAIHVSGDIIFSRRQKYCNPPAE